LKPPPTFVILNLGDPIPDIGYYGMGRFGASRSFAKRYAEKSGISDDQFEKLRSDALKAGTLAGERG
jgi:hypothetical protein